MRKLVRPKALLLAAGVVIASLSLGACGSTDTATPTVAKSATTSTAKSSSATTAATSATVAPTPASGTVTIAGPFPGEAQSLTGAGATFPAVLYTKWFNDAYVKLTGVQVNYQSIGSGGGIKGISDKTVDFGASDSPMTDDQLAAAKGGALLHIPMALGAVVPTYNVPGVSDRLKFTPDTLAGIYLGTITKWNDPKLVADNPALAQVAKDIVVVHRSDGSGTTFVFTDYLSNVSATWKQNVGTGQTPNWPVGLGAKGNEGVSGEVKQDNYSIGYVELIYALQNKLGIGLVKNKAGAFIDPSLDSVTAAAAGIAANIAPDLRASIVNADGAAAYPISTLTWQLVYKEMPDKAKAVALTRLLWWEIHDGQKLNADLGYAPLPAGIVSKAEAKVLSVTTGGASAFPGR